MASFPALVRIVEAPVFAPNGALHTVPGYDPVSRTFYAPTPGFVVDAVPARPTVDEIVEARRLLLAELLTEFPFVSDAERAHALALLLLPFVRELIAGPTPFHLIEKPTPGTGATLLVDAVMLPAMGRSVATLTEGRDEDEWRKRLTAKLIGGPTVVLIDNIRHRLDSAALAAALTSPAWEDRILGQSEMARLPIRAAWIATGNNPALSGEIARRTVRIRLDARVDRPWLREGFRHPDLRGWALEHRGALVRAALTLGQAWIAAGRPRGTATLGMFDSWAETLGGILAVADVPGFLGNASDFYDATDADGAAWRTFVEAWWAKFADEDVSVAELFALVSADDADVDLDLGRGSDRSQRTRVGLLLHQHRDRQFAGYRIVAGGRSGNKRRWRLRQVSA